MTKHTAWTVDDGNGNQLAAGLPAQTARRTAQRLADERGESVFLYESPIEGDASEEIAPSEIEVELDAAVGPRVTYGAHDESAVEAQIPEGWAVDWSNAVDISTSGTHRIRYAAPLRKVGQTAAERIEALIGEREVIETERHLYNGHAIVIHTLVGNPDSDGDDYYAEETAVAWDAALDVEGEVGACYVDNADLATWLSLRFPATIGGAGFARDGQWYEDGMEAVRG